MEEEFEILAAFEYELLDVHQTADDCPDAQLFDYFPLYRRATFKRQRSYLKTERVR